MFILRELRVADNGNVIGYRLTSKFSNKSCDFDARVLLDSADFIPYFRVFLDKCLFGKIENGLYTCSDEAFSFEANSSNELKSFLSSEEGISDCQYIESILYVRYLVCKYMVETVGIEISKNIASIEISERLSRSWGICKRRRVNYFDYTYRIVISHSLLKLAEIEGIDMVILHELLHTCEGCFNHGYKWKSLAKRLCDYYGYNISRLTSAEELGVNKELLIKEGYYACQCVDCGNIITRKTLCEFIKHPEDWVCDCGGSFIRIS